MERNEEHYEQRHEKRGCDRPADIQDGFHEASQEERVMEIILS